MNKFLLKPLAQHSFLQQQLSLIIHAHYYKFLNDPNKISRLHSTIHIKKKCLLNYVCIKDIDTYWTTIEPIVKEIRIGKTQSYVMTRIQFLVQLAITRTIHRSQGFSLDELVLDPKNVTKHDLTYTIVYHVRKKENLYSLNSLCNENFNVKMFVNIAMNRLKIIV